MRRLLSLLVAIAAAAVALPTWSAELKVLTAGALKPVVAALAPEFERTSGHRLVVENDTAGNLVRRVGAGEPFDVVIVTGQGVEQLTQAGLVGAKVPLLRIGIGVAAMAGATGPDIGSVPAFRQALLDARKVAYIDPAAGGSSGIYMARLFERLGVAAEIARKAVLVPGGLVAQRLLSGEADLAIQQITELHVVPGVTVLGPLPAEIQNYTLYAGAVGAKAGDAAAAKAFLAALAAAAARTVSSDGAIQAP